MLSDLDTMVGSLVGMGVPRERAEARVREELGLPPASAAIPAVDVNALERAIEHAGDVLMQELGFEVIRFSHPGKTMQTPGIADRRYYRRPRTVERGGLRFHRPAVILWWEAKSNQGEQRPGQVLFQELVEACGEYYCVGELSALVEWLVAHRIARRVTAGGEAALEPLDEPLAAPVAETAA
jgi:hypothetical protein